MNKQPSKGDGGAKKRRAPQDPKRTTKARAPRRKTATTPVSESTDVVATAVMEKVPAAESGDEVSTLPVAASAATGRRGDATPRPTEDETGRARGRGRSRGRRGGRGRGRGRRDTPETATVESEASSELPSGSQVEGVGRTAPAVEATVAPETVDLPSRTASRSAIEYPIVQEAEDLPFGFGLSGQAVAEGDRGAPPRLRAEDPRAGRTPPGRFARTSPPTGIGHASPAAPLKGSTSERGALERPVSERAAAERATLERPLSGPQMRLSRQGHPVPLNRSITSPGPAGTSADTQGLQRADERRDRGRGRADRNDRRDRPPRRGAPAPAIPAFPRFEGSPPADLDSERVEAEDEVTPATDVEAEHDDLFPEVAPEVEGDVDAVSEATTERRGGGPRRRGRRSRGRGEEESEAPVDEGLDESPTRIEPEETETEEEPESFDEEIEDEPLPADYQWVEAKLDRPKHREMVINVSGHEECRIAILQDGRLEELFIERTSSQSHVGNIYKGRVTNVEPSIQAAFIDFGLPKNGFLHISDVQPQYFPNHSGAGEDVGRKIPRHHRPPIQKCFRRGQEVIVQITKEGVGTKGPTLTTYLSMPGRFLVMMPGMNRHGVSRKIEDEQARREMRDVLNQLTFPPGMGFILRTAGMDRNKRELQRDLHYLMRLWKRVVERVKRNPSPAELYRESDLITRTIRDCYTADFDRVIVDDTEAARKVSEFLRVAMPRSRPPVELYTSKEPLFYRLRIEEEIERINARHVPLPSGGSLVIDSTEALVAIDVNSGRFRSLDDAEETALRINLEAADEIARQLRLRDLGGLIVCDFIDLRLERNRRKVERALRDALKHHKERARCLRMSAFGLIEMTRQRQGPSMKRNIYSDCVHCRGSGLVKMPESVVLDVMRHLQLGAYDDRVKKVTVTVSNEMAYQILNTKRAAVSRIESETGVGIVIRGDANFTTDQIECLCEDGRGQPVAIGA